MTILIREGKKEGFCLLYSTYAGPLYGILFRITGDKQAAENLLEATFVYICKRIHEFTGSCSFLTWAIKAAMCVSQAYRQQHSAGCKDAIELVFFGGYDYDQAAEHMNTSKEQVRAGVREQLRTYRTL